MGVSLTSSKNGAISEMNVVPLIDILLVLLIIFMVITPLTPTGLDAMIPQRPQERNDAIINDNFIVVQILPSGSMKINSQNATWDTLESRLTQIFKLRAERIAFVKGDNNLQFEQVARAIDIMHNANIDKVGLITSNFEAGR